MAGEAVELTRALSPRHHLHLLILSVRLPAPQAWEVLVFDNVLEAESNGVLHRLYNLQMLEYFALSKVSYKKTLTKAQGSQEGNSKLSP